MNSTAVGDCTPEDINEACLDLHQIRFELNTILRNIAREIQLLVFQRRQEWFNCTLSQRREQLSSAAVSYIREQLIISP